MEGFTSDLDASLENFKILNQSKEITLDKITNLLKILNGLNFLNEHPLFRDMDNILTESEISQVLVPFYFAVSYWLLNLSNFKNKLLNVGDTKSADLVNENILDEQGYDNGVLNIEKCHTTTYLYFLDTMNTKKFHSDFIVTDPIKKFINALENSVNHNSLAYHACVLGSIEHFYIQISANLKLYCDKKNIKQYHYTTHEILDHKHSLDFFKIALNQNVSLDDMISGIKEGYILLWTVYEEMLDDYYNY